MQGAFVCYSVYPELTWQGQLGSGLALDWKG